MKNESKSKSFHDWIKHWIEIAGILFGIIGVCVLIFQSCEMVKATKATLKSVDVSRAQMEIMKRQLNDSEAQQRALLRFGQFTTTISTNLQGNILTYALKISYTIKNIGYSPAIDLEGSGVSFEENELTEKMDESLIANGQTNFLKRWDHHKTPVPSPYSGDPFNGGTTVVITPQETITNGTFMFGGEWRGGDYYFEQWISYRDIFWRSWIIGEGGHYDFTNNVFVPEFIYSSEYRQQDQTNSALTTLSPP